MIVLFIFTIAEYDYVIAPHPQKYLELTDYKNSFGNLMRMKLYHLGDLIYMILISKEIDFFFSLFFLFCKSSLVIFAILY